MSEKIKLAQGAGGQMMDKLIKQKILKYFEKSSESAEIPLSMLDDSAVIDDIVFSTDSHTVQPIIFPGGDLGSQLLLALSMILLLWAQNQLLFLLASFLKKGYPSKHLN